MFICYHTFILHLLFDCFSSLPEKPFLFICPFHANNNSFHIFMTDVIKIVDQAPLLMLVNKNEYVKR